MKRALFCVWMVLALGWCTAWAETDWPPMTTEVMDDERFSIVEEGETRFLRYERKQGDTWATIWENDAILPDGVDLHRQFSRRRRMGDEMVYSKGGAAGFRLRQLEAGGGI